MIKQGPVFSCTNTLLHQQSYRASWFQTINLSQEAGSYHYLQKNQFFRGTGGGKPPTGNALKLKAKCLIVQERKRGKQNQKTKQMGV
jgi:hypothetical protein